MAENRYYQRRNPQQSGQTLDQTRSELGGKNRWDGKGSAFSNLNMGSDNKEEAQLISQQAQLAASRAEQDKNAEFWGNVANAGLVGLGTVAGGVAGSLIPGAGTVTGATIGGTLGSAAGGLANSAIRQGFSSKEDDPAFQQNKRQLEQMQLKKAREAALMQAIGMLR